MSKGSPSMSSSRKDDIKVNIKDGIKAMKQEGHQMKRPFEIPLAVYLFLLIIFLAGIQTWAIYKNTRIVSQISSELGTFQEIQLNREKSKQEVIGLKIKNEAQGLFLSTLFTSIGPLITTLVALIGALLGLRNYLDTRKKERVERAANDLKGLLTNTADNNARLRIVGVVGLQHFFTPEKKEYHLQALSSLVAMARMEKDEEVQRNIKIAVEKALRNVDHETLKQVTWQGVILRNVNFSGQNLRQIDFRDAVLDDADFSKGFLDQTILVNTRLNGARFDKTSLTESDLTYADLAGASFAEANLKNAKLDQTKVLRMNIRGADLRGAEFDMDKMPWPLINGWREAIFDEGIKESLIAIHGPAPSGVRVMMLLWEIPPLVAGGTWTAAYHLVRNLKKRGVRLTVVVPWDESAILPNPFGCDVDLIALGITLPQASVSPYQQPWSPYGSPSQPWGWGSPYMAPTYTGGYSPYDPTRFASPYSTLSGPREMKKGTGILRLTEEFKRRFVKLCRNEDFDIIHAHDWVTFNAAEAAAEIRKKPWVAHFHSTEYERRITGMDAVLIRLEQKGAENADQVMVPSRITANVISSRYSINMNKINVMPNPISAEEIPPIEMGDFETHHVTFTGRITEQKRPDLFINIADRLYSMKGDCRFRIFGEGELQSLFPRYTGYYDIKGTLPWERRGEAYKNSSAVIVTSRAEPFGMVILEAMQHHVPVFYPSTSGAAEVMTSGIKINPEDTETVALKLRNILENWELWEAIVEEQMDDINAYATKPHELILIGLWDRMHIDRA